jgi:AcrR family transcriptional regulator
MPRRGAGDVQEGSTRERILDVALNLFIEKGFDKTSLREIAEALGFSKAAVYYHFASKDDILMALHLRLHELFRDPLDQLRGQAMSAASWAVLLDRFIDGAISNRKLFVMHERNQAAFEHLHTKLRHDEDHDDIEQLLRAVLVDSTIPLRSRVRMACALGAVVSGLLLAGETFANVPSDELAGILRDATADLLELNVSPI